MSVSIAVYGMSSRLQWLSRLHCAGNVARCIVLDFLRDNTHTHTHILVSNNYTRFGYKIARNLVLRPLFLSCLYFVLASYTVLGGKWVRLWFC